MAAELLDHLAAGGANSAVAQSLTGGLLTDAFVTVLGAYRIVLGVFIAPATDLKASLLGVAPALLARCGAVDPVVVEQMAAGARERLEATYGVSTTGVAGPDAQDGQPVGTVYVGVAGPGGTGHTRVQLHGDRAAIRAGAVEQAVATLARTVGRA